MNKITARTVMSVIAALATSSALFAQAPGPSTKMPGESKRKEVHVRTFEHPVEMESVTFLGVETGPVSDTLIAQLNLPSHSGLVVLHIVPDSAAAAALKEHDILLKLDDQILIDQHQLSVLIRNHKEGDQVAVTYIRAGKQATANVKLTKHDVPKFSDMMHASPHILPLIGTAHARMLHNEPGQGREDVDHVLSMIERAHNGEPMRMRIEHGQGPGMRAVSINTGNSNLVYSDDKGSLELTFKDGTKSLIAKDAKGAQQFSGNVTTEEERKALPVDVRERLERLEAMHDVTFHTDADFEGAETKVFDVEAKPIGLPHLSTSGGPVHRYY